MVIIVISIINRYLYLLLIDWTIIVLITSININIINSKLMFWELLQNMLKREKTALGKVVTSIFKPISERDSIKKSMISPKFLIKKLTTYEYLSGKMYLICNIINKNIAKIDILESLDIQNIILYMREIILFIFYLIVFSFGIFFY